MIERRCGDCEFWRDEDADGQGFCHRYPASPQPDPEIGSDLHSLVHADDWCGEFRPREVEEPAAAEFKVGDRVECTAGPWEGVGVVVAQETLIAWPGCDGSERSHTGTLRHAAPDSGKIPLDAGGGGG